MSFRSCSEAIARIQRSSRTPTTTKEFSNSYRDFTLREFKLLSPPEPTNLAIVHSELPPKNLTFPGWTSYPTGDKLSFERRRKEEKDRKYHAASSKPPALTPGERRGWFLSAEAKQAVARIEQEWFEQLTPEQILDRRFRLNYQRMKRKGVKYMPEDERWQDWIARRKQKPKLGRLSSIQKLMVEAYGMAERGSTQHEIAAELQVTRRQVQTLLRKSATILVSAATT